MASGSRPGCLCDCLNGVRALFQLPKDHESKRLDFEQTLAFLGSVPLFKKQLKRSELPKVAQNLTRRVWRPGKELVHQGDTGKALFLIQAGQALVVTSSCPGEPPHTRATLHPGDYFGGHTLMTERPNIATIVAKGPEPLVTLSMSRVAFDECGLKRKLHFPKRPAIYEDHGSRGGGLGVDHKCSSLSPSQLEKSPEEEAFIREAVRKNANLRALLEASDDMLKGIASAAERRIVPRGTVVARCGEAGQELFVIHKGAFDVLLPDSGDKGQQSAEAAVAHSTMAERLLRKQHFLRSLSRCTKLARGRSTSMVGSQLANRAAKAQQQAWTAHSEAILERRTPAALSTDSIDQPLKRGSLPGIISPEYSKRSGRQPKQGGRVKSVSDASESALLPRAATLAADAAQEAEVLEPAPAATLGAGESFGELSLLYNTRREATFRAREDSVVYVVGRRHFTRWFRRRNERFQKYCKLLEEVHLLTPLVSSERWDLACNSTGLVDFCPGERVLHQGKVREARKWYVVFSGSCSMTQERAADGGEACVKKLAELRRGAHFGERSLLRGDAISQVNVIAGPVGMTCLTFDGESVRPLLLDILSAHDGIIPSVNCDIAEWCAGKAKGWDRQVSPSYGEKQAASEIKLGQLHKIGLLGRGGFGEVTLVEDPSNRAQYALKSVSKGHVQEMGSEQQICWERELLTMLDSPFIVNLLKTFNDEQHVHFLLEAALGGNLFEVLNNQPEVFSRDSPRGSSAAFYAACITSAIEHLHERKIVHRDIKPENALLDARGYAKLCDMGFARFILGKSHTLVGTPEYMAPEMIEFPHTHDAAVDWWALGVLTYELLTGQTPWEEDDEIAEPMERLLAIRRSQERCIMYPFHFPDACRGFVGRLLLKLPHRLGATRGAAAVWDDEMWSSMQFNFQAFRSRYLKSPYVAPEKDIGSYMDPDMSDGHDEIFVPYVDNGSAWDKNF